MSHPMYCALLALFLMPRLAVAQTVPTLKVGQRIRIAYRCGVARGRVIECPNGDVGQIQTGRSRPLVIQTGRLQALDADTIRMRTEKPDAVLAIPRASIDRVWVHDGTKHHGWTGAGIGLLAGAVMGGIAGAGLEVDIGWGNPSPATGLGVVAGAVGGFVIGGIVGSLVPSDRWLAVPPAGLHMTLEPGPRSIELGASVRF